MDLTGKRIALDPGHGGDFPGKVYNGRKEKDVTLMFSKVLRTVLETEGAKVYMTRIIDKDFGGTTDAKDVNERVKKINNYYADDDLDILLSIHVNTDNLFNRVGAAYQEGGKASKILAENIATKYTTFQTQAIAWSDDLAVLRDTTVAEAKALLEIGKINQDWYDDPDQVERAAYAIVAGIYDYFREIE